MTNPLECIRQRPHLAKQIIGLNLTQLDKLISQAIAYLLETTSANHPVTSLP